DGDTSLGVVDAAPFELDVAVSSADSGAHAYSALATDTAGQTAQSEEVSLSINIVGGAIEQLREDLFQGIDAFGLINGRVRVVSSDRVVVTSSVPGEPSATGQLLVYTTGLSQIYDVTRPDGTPAPAVPHPDGFLVPRVLFGETFRFESFAPDSATATVLGTYDVSEFDSFNGGFPRALASADGFVITQRPDELARVSDTLSDPSWTASVSDGIVIELAHGPADSTLVSYFGTDCAQGRDGCLRRIATDGSTQWTRGLDEEAPHAIATAGDGLTCVVSLAEGASSLWLYSEDGEVTVSASLGLAPTAQVRDIAGSPTGGCIVAATVGEGTAREATVVHYDSNLDEVWRADDIVQSASSMAFSVDATSSAVFALGISGLGNAGLGGTSGDAWVARISL
ncbi:MAG: hypothetical protein NXI35_38475, partial [bacterium]|nr:hypothetical protein [bacterium]